MTNSNPLIADEKPTKATTMAMFMDDMPDNLDSDDLAEQYIQENETQSSNSMEAQPSIITDTSVASTEPYVPMLPKAVGHNKKRLLIMDTETTGFEYNNGDRIIEVGIVEMVGRKLTGEKLHVYVNPDREEPMSEEVIRVHGITDAFLADKPKFKDIAKQVYDFMEGAEVIAHNASFDMNFLDMEFQKVRMPKLSDNCQVTDSLVIAKNQYPGQRNTLDALVKRLDILTKDRTFHGALLDAEILADVYLAMTGGQVKLSLGETSASLGAHTSFTHQFAKVSAPASDLSAHTEWLSAMADNTGNDDFLTNWGMTISSEEADETVDMS